jgi:site-specific recombinase XerD
MNSAAMQLYSKDFFRYLSTEKDVSANTKRAYTGDIREFISFTIKNGYTDVDQQAIRAFMADIYGDLKKSSISRKVSSIKVFFKFLKKKGYITDNPAALIKNPRIEKRLPKFFTVDEIFHFLDTLPEETWINRRNRAIFELIYSAGMRAQEVLDLDLTDVHLEGLWAIVKGKGGKERVLPFGEKAKSAVMNYLAEAAGHRRDDEPALLSTNRASGFPTGAC